MYGESEEGGWVVNYRNRVDCEAMCGLLCGIDVIDMKCLNVIYVMYVLKCLNCLLCIRVSFSQRKISCFEKIVAITINA